MQYIHTYYYIHYIGIENDIFGICGYWISTLACIIPTKTTRLDILLLLIKLLKPSTRTIRGDDDNDDDGRLGVGGFSLRRDLYFQLLSTRTGYRGDVLYRTGIYNIRIYNNISIRNGGVRSKGT